MLISLGYINIPAISPGYYLILPVALSSFTALSISNHLFPPLLEQILEQDGRPAMAMGAKGETTMFSDAGKMKLCKWL